MLNFERLRVLHAVSTTGSVAGAARVLHVTTSAISQQMARLERETGQRLAERQGRVIRLTEAGLLLARNAGYLLAQVAQLEPAAPRDGAGHPPAVPGGLSRLDLIEDPFDAALPADHPLSGRETITLSELAAEDWISWSTGQICHEWLTRTLRADGTEPRIRHTASEHSTQLALVAAGLGTALIPRLGREPAPPPVRFVPLDPPPTRHIFALWRASSAARPAIGATLNALQRQCTPRT